MRLLVLSAVLAMAPAAMSAQAAKPSVVQAEAALQAGEADQALNLLAGVLHSGQDLAQAHNLKCRVLYTLEQWDAAADECQTAANLEPQNAYFQLWLARSLGEKANHASFLNAYSLAKRVRVAFEEAARLGPQNGEILSDLAEFYNNAPGIVGGGVSKAENVAVQLDRVDQVRAHELRGRIALGRKDLGTAEREFKLALSVSQHPAFQWTTLASLYQRAQRWDDLDAAIRSCQAAAQKDKRAGVALYDAASILIASDRDAQLAIRMIESYLAGPRTDEAPAFQAYTRLARLRAKSGDAAGARREQAAALALAHNYRPAQDLNVAESKH